jgi:hypothetical protein
MTSSKELQDRLKDISEEIRNSDWGNLPWAGQISISSHRAVKYVEAVSAVLLDAMVSNLEAAAKDREAQDKNRAVQRWQGWTMVVFTVVIAISTALYTVAAWKQAQQSERTFSQPAAVPMIGPSPPVPPSLTRD